VQASEKEELGIESRAKLGWPNETGAAQQCRR